MAKPQPKQSNDQSQANSEEANSQRPDPVQEQSTQPQEDAAQVGSADSSAPQASALLREAADAVEEARQVINQISERWNRQAVNHGAEQVAMALLQNPRIEQFIAGPPFDGHKCEDGLSIGQFLARRCFAIARDFRDELGRIEEEESEKLMARKA